MLQQFLTLIGLEPMRSRLTGVVVAAALMMALFLLARTLANPGGRPFEPLFVYAALAAPVVLGCYAVLGIVFKGRGWVEWFLGGDNVRHVVIVSDLIHEGALTYPDPYPRGWHALLSTMWVATHAASPEKEISRFIELIAASSWGLTALLTLALGSTAATVARRVRVPGRAAYLGVGFAGLAGLLPRIASDLLTLGFQTSILSTLVLAVLVRETLGARSKMTSISVLAACCVCIAHSWQIFLPIPVCVIGVGCLLAWRELGRTPRIGIIGVAVLTALGCWVPMIMLLRAVDVGAAVALPGVAPDIPWALTALGTVAFFHVARRASDWRPMGVAAVGVFGPALTAFALVLLLGVDMSDYYPTKMLWTTAVLSVPFVGASAAIAASSDAVPRWTRRVMVVVVVVVMAFGVGSPAGALLGAWSTVRGDVVIRAIETPGAGEAEGVWMHSATETTIVRTLLDVYRPERPLGVLRDGVTLEQECVVLRTLRKPVVISTHDSDVVQRRYSCAPVSVLRVDD